MPIKLKFKHIIMLSRIVDKMQINLDVKGKKAEEVGGQLLMDVFKNVHKAENDFYELIGDITEKTAEEAANTEIDDILEIIGEIGTKIISFFKQPAGAEQKK